MSADNYIPALTSNLEIEFDEGMSSELPYPDDSFDLAFSSLFFHHLTRENKITTIREVGRVLKPNGELHVADWGSPDNWLMKVVSNGIRALDGAETTADNFEGLLPSFFSECGFREVVETSHFNTWFGTIRLVIAIKIRTYIAMKRTLAIGIFVSSIMLLPVFGHDLFLKLDNCFVGVNEKVTITILNGAFQASEGAVNFARPNA